MARLDHMSLPVSDWKRSRDWWRDVLGFKVEFEIPDRATVAMVDEADLTVFLEEGEVITNTALGFTIQVDDVEARHAELAAKSVAFVHPPMKVFWGYGAELNDPDGYRLYLWDEVSMREKGGG
ncbi:MAG TPA: VOC family protein [Caulobacteraceae bacterium]|nr:VOC family protein [Caulobacteraceae bacterium]